MKYWYISTGLHIAISWGSICPSYCHEDFKSHVSDSTPKIILAKITNQNAPYTIFSSTSVPSSQVALLFSQHCSAVSLSVLFPQHETFTKYKVQSQFCIF
jgi:hypothetical protein